tara:strand:+ start:5554 stop:6816 length:1263 start_codon:yes stop_codon:yes gene_type:complete
MSKSGTLTNSNLTPETLSSQGKLPKGWRMVRFDEIAESVNERVNPAETDLDVYVGLEHLDPESLKIRRWGTPDDVTGQKLRFRVGDIIFGKRRAYQRKLAIADCDGICSAHAMVLRAKTELVEPDFLPFFMQSDMFMERAVDISVGSLSPTINWKTLRIQEFPLPPKDEQRRLVEILTASNAILHSRYRVISDLLELRKSILAYELKGVIGHSSVKQFQMSEVKEEWNLVKISEIATVIRGSSPRPKGDPRYYGGDIPRLMVADITRDGKYITPCIDYLTEEGEKKSRPVPAGTFVLVCSGGTESVGLPGIMKIDACIHDGIIGLTDILSSCEPEWLFYIFTFFQTFLNSAATHGGTFVNLTTDIVKGIQIALPPPEFQVSFIKRMRKLDDSINRTRQQLELDKNLLKKIGDYILSGRQL